MENDMYIKPANQSMVLYNNMVRTLAIVCNQRCVEHKPSSDSHFTS